MALFLTRNKGGKSVIIHEDGEIKGTLFIGDIQGNQVDIGFTGSLDYDREEIFERKYPEEYENRGNR